MDEPPTSARRAAFRTFGALLLTAACGCVGSSVRLVSQTPEGGVIAIPNNSDQWPTYYRRRAEELMKQTCPDGYAIDHEEVFTVVPERSAKQAPNDDEYYEYNGALEKVTRYRREEYRITFHCASPPSPSPTPPSSPPAPEPSEKTLHMPAPLPVKE